MQDYMSLCVAVVIFTTWLTQNPISIFWPRTLKSTSKQRWIYR